MRTPVFAIAVAAAALVCNSAAGQSGQNKSVPNPQPATSAPPRTTGSKTAPSKTSPTNTRTNKTAKSSTRSKGHQSGKKHGHSSGGGVDVGVSVDVDLGGIGQRRAEPDPFAVPAERQPVIARTAEKPKTPKKPREVAKTDPFASVQLTGEQAKEQSNPQ